MMLGTRPRGNTKTKYFPLKGGLALETPPLSAPPGALLIGTNYEPLPKGGYRRLGGFERFDGRPKPYLASYWVIRFTGSVSSISDGDIVANHAVLGSATAVGEALIVQVDEGGGAGYIVVTVADGYESVSPDNFLISDTLYVGATVKATVSSLPSESGAGTVSDDSLWSQDAIETARARIQPVPGSGPVRGIWVYKNSIYAFRDNAGGTAGVMHKATISGWVAQSLGLYLPFTSGGTYEVKEGDTIVGAISGATATVTRVALQSGTFSGGDAAGYLIFASQTGTFSAESLNVGANIDVCTIAGDSTANALPPGGRYEFVNHNFYANADAYRMYGVNGVGMAFEWDGAAFVPISTGNSIDTPKHIAAHKFHLFLSFDHGSLQNSGTGTPYEWYTASGAAEIGVGDEIVGMLPQTGGTLAVFTDSGAKVLYGSISSEWELREISAESGAKEWTIQDIGRARFLNDHGLTTLENIQEFGDFDSAIFSQEIERILSARAGTAIGSLAVKGKNQYRLFYPNGFGVICTFDGYKPVGFTSFKYDKNITCTGWGKNAIGSDLLFFGDDAGYVYQVDSGDSFDGENINSVLKLTYYHLGSPSYDKQFRKISIESEALISSVISYQASYDYGSAEIPIGLSHDETVLGSGSYWDSVNWDQFYWASEEVSVIEGDLEGSARNISITLYSSSAYTPAYTLYGVTYHYSMRRLVR